MKEINLLSMGLAYDNFIINDKVKMTDILLDYKFNSLKTMSDDFKDIIIIYNDDLMGLLTYKIASIFGSIFNKQVYILGKIKKTKKYFSKNTFPNIIKRLPEKAIYLSSFNPIYYVEYPKKSFNFFSNKKIQSIYQNQENIFFEVLDIFTPEQLRTLFSYYFTEKQLKTKLKLFNKLYFILNNFDKYITDFSDCQMDEIAKDLISKKHFYIFHLTGEEKDLSKLYTIANDKNNICLYFSENSEIVKDRFFLRLLPQNIPNIYNYNNKALLNWIKQEIKNYTELN